MARPKAEFPPAEAIRALADGEGRLALRVTPGARTESVELGEAVLLVKVRTKPEDGKANEAVGQAFMRNNVRTVDVGNSQLNAMLDHLTLFVLQ